MPVRHPSPRATPPPDPARQDRIARIEAIAASDWAGRVCAAQPRLTLEQRHRLAVAILSSEVTP